MCVLHYCAVMDADAQTQDAYLFRSNPAILLHHNWERSLEMSGLWRTRNYKTLLIPLANNAGMQLLSNALRDFH